MMTRVVYHDKVNRLPHGSVALIGNFGPATGHLFGINAFYCILSYESESSRYPLVYNTHAEVGFRRST